MKKRGKEEILKRRKSALEALAARAEDEHSRTGRMIMAGTKMKIVDSIDLPNC